MADTTGTYSAEQVERLLTCPVCLDRFNNPKILPCQHTFCRSPCLEGLIDIRTRLIKCPECRSHHMVPREGADSFPTNITLSRFLDLPAQRSETPAVADGGSAVKCGVCETEAETSRCHHCDKMVCASCKQSHSGQMKTEVTRLLNQVRRGIPKLSNSISSVEQKSEQLKTRVETVKSEVKDTVERYAKELKDREKMLNSELDTYLQGEQRLLRLHQENIEVELASISSYCDATEKTLNQADNADNPEPDLANIKRQCTDYLSQIQAAESHPAPELREVAFRFDGQPVHSSISSLGEVVISTPGSSSSSTESRRQPDNPSASRSRWSDVEPLDMAAMENFRVSPSFSYASRTARTGRRSHSPPPLSHTTHYSRPTHSSTDMNRRFSGLLPNQTMPSESSRPSRRAPSTEFSNYMFNIPQPSSEDLLDIMDRNRQAELSRRGRGRSGNRSQPRPQERVAGLMGGGGGGGASTMRTFQPASPEIPTSPYSVIPGINRNGPSRTADRVLEQAAPPDNPDIARAAAEAAERRARNTALTRQTSSRPAAAFIIPLSGGPVQEIEREGRPTANGTAAAEANGQADSQPSAGATTDQAESQTTEPEPPAVSNESDQPNSADQPVSSAPAAESQSSSQQANPPAENQSSQNQGTTPQVPAGQTTEEQPSGSQQPDSEAQTSMSQPSNTDGNQQAGTSQAASSQQANTSPGTQTNTSQRTQSRQASTKQKVGQAKKNQAAKNQQSAPPAAQSDPSTSNESPPAPEASHSGPSQRPTPSSRRSKNPSNQSSDRGNNKRRKADKNTPKQTPTRAGAAKTQATPTSSNNSTANQAPALGDRSRTFVQEDGPSTSSNVPDVRGSSETFAVDTSGTFDVPLTETLGDIDPAELANVSVEDSLSVSRPIINYRSKSSVRAVIGGERGNEQGRFTWPRGVAVSPVNSQIVVADSSNHRVQMFQLTGSFVATFGSYGQANGEFDCLAGVAVNSMGQIIIADRYNHRIQVFDRYGQFCHQFGREGTENGQMNYPWGVAVDRGGCIYVCDKENHRIQVFQSDGTFVRKFGKLGSRTGQLENPHYVAVGFDGNVYVSDSHNHRVQVFSDTGRFIRAIGAGEGSGSGQLKYPKGVAVDRQGFVVVADSGNHRIQVFRGDGRVFCEFGERGSEDGRFKGLEGLALSGAGDLVVSDKENHRIQVF